MRYLVHLLAVLLVSGFAYGQAPLTISTQPGFPIVGQDLNVEISFEEEAVTEASIAVRSLGSLGEYTVIDATLTESSAGHVFTVTLPANAIVPQGIETFVTYLLDGQTFTFPEIRPETFPLRTPTLTPRLRADVLLIPREYRMVGIPFQFIAEQGGPFGTGTLDEVFADDFGPYNPLRWRVLRWDALAEEYLEGDDAVERVTPGEGFWLITNLGGEFDVEGGVTPGFIQKGSDVHVGPVTVTLQPGWNQIAAPYLFPIPWETLSDISEPFAFVNGAYVPGIQTLEPWNGYFVENTGLSSITLWFDVPHEDAGERPPPEVLSFKDRLVDSFHPGDYGFQVTAQTGDLADVHTYLVVGNESLRLAKPPAMQDGLYVAETASGRALTVAPSSSAQWAITIVGDWQSSRPVTVKLHEVGDFPTHMTPQITDRVSGDVIAAPNGQFSFHLGGAQQSRTFDVILVEGDQLMAPEAEDRLAMPFPNPVHSGTTSVSMDYWAEDESTRVDVFDLLGRSIATLVDGHTSASGWQRLNWNATDASGAPLSAGVYLIRYRSGSVVTTRSLTIVR